MTKFSPDSTSWYREIVVMDRSSPLLQVSVSGRRLHPGSRVSQRILSQNNLDIKVSPYGFYDLVVVDQETGRTLYSERSLKGGMGTVELPYQDIPKTKKSREISVILYEGGKKMGQRRPVEDLTFWVDDVAPKDKEHWVSGLGDSNSPESKYCRCLLEVESKGNDYSAYGVCHSATHPSGNPHCGQYYNFENLPDAELRAYAKLHSLSTAGTNEQIIDRIYASKRGE